MTVRAIITITYPAVRNSVMGIANQREPGPIAAGSRKMSAPLTTNPRATETAKEIPGFIIDWKK